MEYSALTTTRAILILVCVQYGAILYFISRATYPDSQPARQYLNTYNKTAERGSHLQFSLRKKKTPPI